MKKIIGTILLTLAVSVSSYSIVLANYTSAIDSFTYNGYYIPTYDEDVYKEITVNNVLSKQVNSDKNINYFNDIKGPKYQSIKSIKNKTIQYKKIKNKTISFSLKAKAPSQKLKYKVIKYPKRAKKFISVSRTGKVTLKKKTKKGTYAIKITAIANKTYAESKKIVKIKVK